MSVLFLIAGLTTMYSLKKRTIGQYYIERFKRLLVPFGDGNILTVYKHFFTTCKDGFYGYDGGFTPAHLWFLHISKKIQWSPVRNWDFQQSLYGIYAYENGYYERMDMAIRMHAIVMVSSLYSNGIWCNRYGQKYLNQTSHLMSWLSSRSFAIYYIHMPVLIATGYFVMRYVQTYTFVQICIMISVSAVVTILLVELCRKIPGIRFVLGMK